MKLLVLLLVLPVLLPVVLLLMLVQFSWTVPPPQEKSCGSAQTAYQIKVVTDDKKAPNWDSGKVASNQSVAVRESGPHRTTDKLAPGTGATWTVKTWIGSCESAESAPATFITAISKSEGFGKGATYIGAAGKKSVFTYLRTAFVAPPAAQVTRAIAFVTATNECGGAHHRLSSTFGQCNDGMTMHYKLYVQGQLASAGPGRGEAPLWGGNGHYRDSPYVTVDVSSMLPAAGGKTLLALETMNLKTSPGALLLLKILGADGKWTTVATEPTKWKAFNADVYYNPTAPKKQHSAGNGAMEWTDARKEQQGWRDSLTFDDSAAGWGAAVEIQKPDAAQLTPRMGGAAVEVLPASGHAAVAARGSGASFFVDFGKEFQGGLVLDVEGGVAGTEVTITTAEMCAPMKNTPAGNTSDTCTSVSQTWGWELHWTLRGSAQKIEQHQYMLFRYATVVFSKPPPASLKWKLSAWEARAPWVDSDTHFESSNKMMNSVWELSAYTLKAAVMDTYADSNTRERRPYEADGLIAASARMLLQRSAVMWARHSHSWIITFPTWPVEWLQITPFLAQQDYWQTGQTDLFESYVDLLYDNTQVKNI